MKRRAYKRIGMRVAPQVYDSLKLIAVEQGYGHTVASVARDVLSKAVEERRERRPEVSVSVESM